MPTFHRAVTAISRRALLKGAQRKDVISRSISTTSLKFAIAHPITAHGPPPKAPSPVSAHAGQRQRDAGPQSGKTSTVLKKRFWNNVDVKQKSGICFRLLRSIYIRQWC